MAKALNVRRYSGKKKYDASVSYVCSNGTGEYIDTGIIPDNNTGLILQFKILVHKNDSLLAGMRGDGLNERFLFGESTRGYYYGWGSYAYHATRDSVEHTYSMNANGNHLLEFDGMLVTTLPSLPFVPNKTIWLFNCNGNTGEQQCQLAIARAIVTQDDEIIRDYKPVRIGNVGALYDSVTRDLYKNNANTGHFSFIT